MIQTIRANKSEVHALPLELRALAIDHPQEPVTRPTGIALYQWRLCTAGAGELLLRGRRYSLKPGTGFFIPAGEPHAYRGDADGFRMDAFGFVGEAAPAVLKALQLLEPAVYRFSHPELFQAHVRVLERIQADGQPFARDRSSGELYKFLLGVQHSILRVADPLTQPGRTGPGFIPELIAYMEEHCGEPLSLDDMSDRFHRSKEHICAAFKKETGITYVDFLTRLRIFRARNLLLDHPEMKLEEVARRCGFSSASYFGARFKRDVGVTPGVFRYRERP